MSLESFTEGMPDAWRTDQCYCQTGLNLTASKFLEVTNLLLQNPNLNSSHLFRADILFDSDGTLQTPTEKESSIRRGVPIEADSPRHAEKGSSWSPGLSPDSAKDAEIMTGCAKHAKSTRWPGFRPQRTVIRKLIPRKPQLDRPLEQTCLVYMSDYQGVQRGTERYIVVYYPHVQGEEAMPWYHPPLKALAYLFEQQQEQANLSVHFLPFAPTSEPLPPRLHRTLLSLLHTFVRLAKHDGQRTTTPGTLSRRPNAQQRSLAPSDLKDTIIPQHLVQDTYTRLKQQYAADLIARWVEQTEPSKHVFEDLAISAFLIELWKQMYSPDQFPGFLDIACGNGVLVYVLRNEGYEGSGFDARRRKTWEMLGIDGYLEERICMPKPFLDALQLDANTVLPCIEVHDGIMPAGTFIISNHADELTAWTPLLAAFSSPDCPLPFLAIPCCSHALSGAKHRYSRKEPTASCNTVDDSETQPANGDLKALRAAKAKALAGADDKSMYACLVRKVVALAEELGVDVELTLMRIPSTRNIGIVGNRGKSTTYRPAGLVDHVANLDLNGDGKEAMTTTITGLLERECAISGGLQSAARTWIDRAQKLQTGKGRGKVNLGGPGHG